MSPGTRMRIYSPLVGGRRSIELWAQGRLVRSLGKPPHTGRTMEHRYGLGRPGGGVELQTETLGIPLIAQGHTRRRLLRDR